MKLLERYGLKERYKGKVLKVLDDYRVIVQVDELILSKPNIEPLVEHVSDSNILNRSELTLENKLESINGIICKPMYLGNCITIPNEGDTVFVMFFEKDPKKIYYINMTNDKPSRNVIMFKDSEHYMIEDDNCIVIRMGNNSFEIGDEEINMYGNVKVNGKKL